jgi:cyanophycinase
MKLPRLFLLSQMILLPVTLPATALAETPAPRLMAVGGGNVSEEMRLHLLSLSSGAEPRLLIIPHAARENNLESSGIRQADHFRRLGVQNIEILDLAEREKALQAIEESDAIWMPGGLQRLLMEALDQADLADAVRARFAAGIPVGGTSAGAAIMSQTMIASSRRDEETGALMPIMSHGLDFWTDIIVDQHFSERSRLPRLLEAVRRHPSLIGIGIDEDTAVLYHDDRVEVMGLNTVTIVRLTGTENGAPVFEKTILRSGESHRFARTAPPACCSAPATP